MADTEIVKAARDLQSDIESLAEDIGQQLDLWDKWDSDEQFIQSQHLDLDVQSTAPGAGDLKKGEVRVGDGTGPNGRDELFWSADGATVARVEADSEIT